MGAHIIEADAALTLELVDAHIHLPAYPDPAPVIELASRSGTLLISCTVNLSEAGTNLHLRADHPDVVRCFLGVHPSDASGERPTEQLEALVAGSDGLGEIGLDPKYSGAGPRSDQMKAFTRQLELAERFRKPIEVHSRNSAKACLDAMTSFRLRSVLMHWFDSEENLPEVNSRGYFVSVGPALLYSKRSLRVALRVPGERLLTETDGPLPYDAIAGRSGPGLIPSVVFALAEAKGLGFDEMASFVRRNASAFLKGL